MHLTVERRMGYRLRRIGGQGWDLKLTPDSCKPQTTNTILLPLPHIRHTYPSVQIKPTPFLLSLGAGFSNHIPSGMGSRYVAPI